MATSRATLIISFFLLIAFAAAAQQPIFDPDDFLDPRQHEGYVFASRLVLGGVSGFIDRYRPTHQTARFLHVTNTVYTSRFQFDFKHSDVRGDPPAIAVCPCQPPVYFPTPPPDDATPAAPPPGPRETFQFGFYAPKASGSVDAPVMLRYRLSWTRQPIGTTVRFLDTNQVAAHPSGDEQSFGVDADTYFHLLGNPVRGSIFLTRTLRSGTADDRNQTELTWLSRFPPYVHEWLFLRATLAVGGISGRGATGLNLVSPSFEAFWHHDRSQINVHLVWNPQTTRSGLEGWRTHHQVALFVDRSLYLRVLGKN